MKKQVDIITMGCSKNLVDSECLLQQFRESGFQAFHNPEELHGGTAIVNTCGFIADAKEESVNMILELCEEKNAGNLEKVIVMGCLSERYLTELRQEIPEVDRFYGKFNWKTLLNDLKIDYDTDSFQRNLTTSGHYAYIKIGEGCNRHCAYCAIPLITKHHVSRPMEDILAEMQRLADTGVTEFQIIEQELTDYGRDLYGRPSIAELVRAMTQIKGVEWIRLHYAYPHDFPLDLLDVIRESPKVCNYLDIALQHINDEVLARMRRHVTKADTLKLIEEMRRRVPGICIRTTLMVGFPGETEEQFQELVEFVKWARFDRMGAFAYSEEDGTYAALHYEDDVPADVKQRRLEKLMQVQQQISTQINQERVGQSLKTVIDRLEGDYFIGRTEYDSPDVDCEVLIPHTEQLEIGKYYLVKITDADEFDLYGTTLTDKLILHE